MPRSKKKGNADGIAKQLAGLTLNSTAPPDSDSGSEPKHKRLCADLGISGDLGSKTKCRKEIKSVNVNIKQFLQSKNKPEDVRFFKNRHALIQYTRRTSWFFPRRKIPKGDPLAALLKEMDD
ncbi:uncharacterized protein NECHADRAFT_74914 [Fusarium vanettenii 77-13-4]|uniref:Uncharacterized protein n=1 Tax=Fusarium vanettenii (strain ATCC MYA-4622 / CBS 123669 / FGSC 9596 / NRRL 45880 / 77-13-4) TaxID=660122 RepID=C7YHB6_FUSV7|nr:uncharacterized protein NECHADRAFT_74914 [Fusarium vanettenii 77-13-4]EEU48603.1 hypothetical protein NECHADRAFT_74914 [Fusarium vanettenii 77-13-4]